MNTYLPLSTIVACVLLVLFASAVCYGEMLATITEDVETEFATYHPIIVNIVPKARQFTIEPDFSNVHNFSRFDFTDAQKEKLRTHGFVAIHSGLLEMYDVYKDCEMNNIPVFVTVDAVLHVFHEQFDYILKTLEKEQFLSDITALTDAMLTGSVDDYTTAVNADVKEAARHNVAYFAVAKKLLDGTYVQPSYVQSLVDSELSLINAHGGWTGSPLLVGSHDYSQFIVRGHYEGDADLEKYFKAMMWYGYMRFSINDIDPFGIAIPEATLRRMILQGLLVTRLAHKLGVSTENAYDVWNRIYQPTVFFVGKADDINVDAFDQTAKSVYGDDYKNLSPDQLGQATSLDSFIALANALPGHKIGDDLSKSFRFMGQRFVPDSYITEVTSTSGRMPYGLDVMTILGSQRAYEILRDVYSDVPSELEDLQDEFAALEDELWAQNLYWNWLYCLMPLLEIKGEGYPPFVQTTAWQDKDLAAALGSWTELRHDTLLYAKQSVFLGIDDDALNQGYVEPNPEAFARLAALCLYAVNGLDGLGLIRSEFSEQLNSLKETLLVLKTIAEKELTNKAITAEEYSFIKEIGTKMAQMTQFDGYYPGLQPRDWGEELDDMAVVADVHTHMNDCLEEAVGRPLDLYVIVDIAGDLRVTRGAAFSYYEFIQPIAQRLTDSQWKELLDSGSAPDMPIWMNSYFDAETPAPTDPRHSGEKQAEPNCMNVLAAFEPAISAVIVHVRVKDIFIDFHSLDFDSVRAIITGPDGTSLTIPLNEDPESPGEYIGSITINRCQVGLWYVEGQLLHGETVLLGYRTFAQIEYTGVSDRLWILYN
jgi:hypothetical protein